MFVYGNSLLFQYLRFSCQSFTSLVRKIQTLFWSPEAPKSLMANLGTAFAINGILTYLWKWPTLLELTEYFGFGFETESKAGFGFGFAPESKAGFGFGFDPKLNWKTPNPETSYNIFKFTWFLLISLHFTT